MDVKDRSIISPVGPVSPPSHDSFLSPAALTSRDTSFAETLQRVQPKPATTDPKAQPTQDPRAKHVANSSPDQSSNNPADQSPAAAAANAAGSSNPSDGAGNSDHQAATAAPTVSANDSPPAAPTPAEVTADAAAAGLLVVISTPFVSCEPITPAATPPSSLIKALQSPVATSTPAASTNGPVPPAALPTIPTGLQAGLNPALATDGSTEPAALKLPAANEAPMELPTPPAERAGNSAAAIPAISAQATPHPAAVTASSSSVSFDGLTSPVAAAPQAAPVSSTNTQTPVPPAKPSRAPNSESTVDPQTLGTIAIPGPMLPVPAKPTTVSAPGRRDPALDAVTAADPRAAGVEITPQLSLAAQGHSPAGVSPTDQSGQPALISSQGGAVAPPILEQVHPALHQALLQDRQMTITLRPPELGAVQIDIIRQDGQMSARLQTETAAAHQLLTDHLPQLREALTSWGVSADQVQVVRAETSPGNSGSSDPHANSQMSGRNDAQARHETPEQRPPQPQLADEPERDEPPAPVVRSRTALNLRI